MNAEQPKPVPNESTPVWDMVVADMKARDQVGRKRYGTPLQTNNGRDMLQDAYEEALDLVVYLRGAIEERNQVPPPKKLLEAILRQRTLFLVKGEEHLWDRDKRVRNQLRAEILAEFNIDYSNAPKEGP